MSARSLSPPNVHSFVSVLIVGLSFLIGSYPIIYTEIVNGYSLPEGTSVLIIAALVLSYVVGYMIQTVGQAFVSAVDKSIYLYKRVVAKIANWKNKNGYKFRNITNNRGLVTTAVWAVSVRKRVRPLAIFRSHRQEFALQTMKNDKFLNRVMSDYPGTVILNDSKSVRNLYSFVLSNTYSSQPAVSVYLMAIYSFMRNMLVSILSLIVLYVFWFNTGDHRSLSSDLYVEYDMLRNMLFISFLIFCLGHYVYRGHYIEYMIMDYTNSGGNMAENYKRL